MKEIEEVGGESIFIGESADERQRNRELLATTRKENLQEIRSRRTLLARVIDHACYSEDSISQAVVKMLQRAEIQNKR